MFFQPGYSDTNNDFSNIDLLNNFPQAAVRGEVIHLVPCMIHARTIQDIAWFMSGNTWDLNPGWYNWELSKKAEMSTFLKVLTSGLAKISCMICPLFVLLLQAFYLLLDIFPGKFLFPFDCLFQIDIFLK